MCDKKPKVIILPLTYRCNARCKMCDIWKQKDNLELEYSELEKLFTDRLIAGGLQSVNLTGGEPLLRKDLLAIIEMIARNCEKLEIVTINTNGFFSDRYSAIIEQIAEIQKKCRDFKLNFYLSLDGIGGNHDEVRGVPGFFEHLEKTLEIFESLKDKYEFEYSLNFTISKVNYKEMDSVYNYAIKRSIPIDFTYGMESSVYFGNEENSNIGMTTNEEKEYVSSTLNRYMSEGHLTYSRAYYRNLIKMIAGDERRIGCIFADEGLFIHPSGNVYRCWAYDELMGNIKEKSISDIWKDNYTTEQLEGIKNKCRNCYNNCYINYKRIDSIRNLISG
ncbi:MAG: radical SAM protein [Lachnospiraceae bacterium]|nr:radical SAM protein [Lachnospiraceae bacterium]